MPTLILPPRYSEDSNTLWRTAIKLGWNIERLQSWRVSDSLLSVTDPVIYGESMWAGFVAQQLGYSLYEPPLDWLATLPEHLVHRRVEFLTFDELSAQTFPLFAKPANDKTFEARVYQYADELPARDDLSETPVLISEPVEWEVEYRCFITKGQVETLSSYWRGENSTHLDSGEYDSAPHELEQARDFAERVIQECPSDFAKRGVVVDVGVIRGKGWAVIEANPAFASGIYGCDPERVLAVAASCIFKD